MLWLAGLVGIAGAGAAAFAGLSTDTADDEETTAEGRPLHSDQASLLDQIKGYSTTDGLFKAGVPASFGAQPHAPTSAGWGDDVLNEIMSEIAAEDDPVKAPPDAHTTVPEEGSEYGSTPSSAMEVKPSVYQALNHWIAERSGADRLDYEASTDGLMLIWDDSDAGATEPEVTVATDPENPAVMQIAMNGETVAQVHGDASLSASDLTLIPLSSAVEVGLETV